MSKILIFSKEVYTDYRNHSEFNNFLLENINCGNKILFIARDSYTVTKIKNYFNNINLKESNGLFVDIRKDIELQLKELEGKDRLIVIGNRDRDFFMATNNQILYIVPTWCQNIHPKCNEYGIKVKSLKELSEIIKTKCNQNSWYYKEVLDDGTTIYSLMSGMSKISGVSIEEKTLVEGFARVLKEGEVDYYQILFYHFISSISNLPEFKNVDIWSIAPSSGKSFNKEMMEFKDNARVLMHCRNTKKNENLFIRHTAIEKSHLLNADYRINSGAKRHLDTIYINPNYNVAGKNICIFDDYLTHGNTFEAMRNLLRKAGAKNIIFVSLGRFKRDYIYQDYEIEGNVYKPNGFTYSEILKKRIFYRCNNQARIEVENLYDIFNL